MEWSRIAGWNWELILLILGGFGSIATIVGVVVTLAAWLRPRAPRSGQEIVKHLSENSEVRSESAVPAELPAPAPIPESSPPSDPLDALSDDEKALLSWVYRSEDQSLFFSQAMGEKDTLVVGGNDIYPWPESRGIEPLIHKDRRNEWLAVGESLIKRGLLRSTGHKGMYELTGDGRTLGMRTNEHLFPSQERIDACLSRFLELVDGLNREQQRLLRKIWLDGEGAAVVELKRSFMPDDDRPRLLIGTELMGADSDESRERFVEIARQLNHKGFLQQNPYRRSLIEPVDQSRFGILLTAKGRELAEMFS